LYVSGAIGSLVAGGLDFIDRPDEFPRVAFTSLGSGDLTDLAAPGLGDPGDDIHGEPCFLIGEGSDLFLRETLA